jgi:hypothetical protein
LQHYKPAMHKSLAKFSYPQEVSAGSMAGLADNQVQATWGPPVLQPANAPSSAAREVSGWKVVLAGLITLALNAACVLSVLGDQLGPCLEMMSIGLLVASSLGALAVVLRPRRSGIAAQHALQPPLMLLRTE